MKIYVHGRVEGETNTEEGRKKVKERLEILDDVGKMLEKRGFKPDAGEDTGNEDLGTRRVRKSWVKD